LNQAHQDYIAPLTRLADRESVRQNAVEKLGCPRQCHRGDIELRLSWLHFELILEYVEEGQCQHYLHAIVEVLETEGEKEMGVIGAEQST